MQFSDVVPRWRRAGLSGVRLLVLLAALAGLFAMHGLSDHGAAHPGTHPDTRTHHAAAPAVAPATGAMPHGIAATGHAAGHVTATVDEFAGDLAGAIGVVADDTGLGSGHHAAMGLCLAILAGAAVLALRRLRSWPVLLLCGRGDAAGRRPPTRARAPDPPDLHVLSIQRC